MKGWAKSKVLTSSLSPGGEAHSRRRSLKLWTTEDGRMEGRQTDAGAWVYYKLTCESSAQVS